MFHCVIRIYSNTLSYIGMQGRITDINDCNLGLTCQRAGIGHNYVLFFSIVISFEELQMGPSQ